MKENQKKVLVTGGAGFLGTAIVKVLLSKGYDVSVYDNLQRGSGRLADVIERIEFVKGDIRDDKKLINAAKDCHSIVHLAYVNGTEFFYSKPDEVLDIAIKGMQNVITAGVKNNISELFLASSSEVYQTPSIIPTPENVQLVVPDPYNPRFSYGGGKILCELMAIHQGSKVFKKIVIFRPHNVYGPQMGHEHVIPQFIERMAAIKNSEISTFKIQGTGNETRSYIFIDDFANAFFQVFKKGKNLTTYNIGNNEEITSQKLAKTIAKLLGLRITIKATPLKKGSTPRRSPDVTRIIKLGYKKKFSLEKGLIKTIQSYTNSQ